MTVEEYLATLSEEARIIVERWSLPGPNGEPTIEPIPDWNYGAVVLDIWKLVISSYSPITTIPDFQKFSNVYKEVLGGHSENEDDEILSCWKMMVGAFNHCISVSITMSILQDLVDKD